MSAPRYSERGAALAAVLLVMTLLLPIAALALLQARSGLLVQQSLTGDAEALHAADAGLACALASLPAMADAAAVERGPDSHAGTADDGLFPFAGPCPVEGVRVERLSGESWSLRSTGRGRRGATRVLEMTLRRRPLPFTPAAIAHGGEAQPIVDPSCLASGDDHAPGDALGTPSGTAAPLPALAAPSPAGVAASARQRAEAVAFAYGSVLDGARLGEAAAPQLSLVGGGLEVGGEVHGHGVLVIEGRLRIAGALRFQGLVIALDGAIVEPGAEVDIRGSLWVGDGPLELRGGGGVVYCAACLAAADTALAGLLPHGFEAGAWRES